MLHKTFKQRIEVITHRTSIASFLCKLANLNICELLQIDQKISTQVRMFTETVNPADKNAKKCYRGRGMMNNNKTKY